MVIAYVRISTAKQDPEVQKLQIYEYCIKNKINIDEVMEVEMSSRKSLEKRRMNELKDKLNEGDLLICTELDTISANILKNLYPNQTIYNKAFQHHLFDKPYDAFIGNPPFGKKRF